MNKARITIELEFSTITDIENFIAICRDNVAMNNVVGTVPTSKMLIQFLTSAMRNAPTICSYVQPIDSEEHDYNVGLEVMHSIEPEPLIKKKKQKKDIRDMDLTDAMNYGLQIGFGKSTLMTTGSMRSGKSNFQQKVVLAQTHDVRERLADIKYRIYQLEMLPNTFENRTKHANLVQEMRHLEEALNRTLGSRDISIEDLQKMQEIIYKQDKLTAIDLSKFNPKDY